MWFFFVPLWEIKNNHQIFNILQFCQFRNFIGYTRLIMKQLFLLLIFSFAATLSQGQKAFVGIAKYRMAVVGGPDEDSSTIVFDKNRILHILYVPDEKDPQKINEISILSDFSDNKQYILNKAAKTYRVGIIVDAKPYDFINTNKIMLVKGDVCFHYKADSSQIDNSKMLRGDCLAASIYKNENIRECWFMDAQPIIIDSRIVMDFIVTEPDGSKPRIYISDITEMKSVDGYFDLTGYREIK